MMDDNVTDGIMVLYESNKVNIHVRCCHTIFYEMEVATKIHCQKLYPFTS